MKHIKNIIYIIVLSLSVISCGEYQALLKSTDYNLKYEKAKEYYEEEEYEKAATLLQEVVPIFKGTSIAQESMYLQAMTYFRQGDYAFAEHYFTQIIRTYPEHKNIMECYFNKAYCYYMQSPRAKLDQSTSMRAIEAFAIFMEFFPNDPASKEAKSYIDEMQDKLAYKAFLNAKLYFDLGSYLGNNYESAIITAKNCLKNYPGNIHSEDLSFLILNASYVIAENSIEEKKGERYRAVIDEYYTFINDYANSDYKKKADVILNKAQKFLN